MSHAAGGPQDARVGAPDDRVTVLAPEGDRSRRDRPSRRHGADLYCSSVQMSARPDRLEGPTPRQVRLARLRAELCVCVRFAICVCLCL